ncbi:uncharacterized protein EDB93DRAFT_1154693 [Suillus bovinus]|uniref:uncharacterized protein n=1 Tax=Suillus bovinus TaxID=48563 RepID=UPI001B86EE3B|nr:uncharacterized protein EDB93DRAFT_1154693 [Suillus bovinus]KAG2143774.1 hypothetical protein EDB93DRAFT_1154693 [Suillus bovinus]
MVRANTQASLIALPLWWSGLRLIPVMSSSRWFSFPSHPRSSPFIWQDTQLGTGRRCAPSPKSLRIGYIEDRGHRMFIAR